LCLVSLGAYSQNSYLLSVEHRDPVHAERMYFYLQELEPGADVAQTNVLTLENALYRIYYFRLREPSASSYFGCSKYGDEETGEKLSLQDLLTGVELDTYDQMQQGIEAQCMAMFDNKGRQNSLLTVDLGGENRIKMLKVQLDICTCKVSHDKFSTLSDTLAMPRKVIHTDVFSDAEKSYWQGHVYEILENTLVRSCLPEPDRYMVQAYEVGVR
jgi:hypothetical protein